MNEQELVQQLRDLPKTIEAKDQWSQIQQAIEAAPQELQDINQPMKKAGWKFPMAIAASVFAVAFIAVFIPKQNGILELNLAQQKTLQSLQQANGQYYSILGNLMQQEAAQLPSGYVMTLKDLRIAQKSYYAELSEKPQDTVLFKKLIKTYHTERQLLKRLLS